jgi:hypothetical protein
MAGSVMDIETDPSAFLLRQFQALCGFEAYVLCSRLMNHRLLLDECVSCGDTGDGKAEGNFILDKAVIGNTPARPAPALYPLLRIMLYYDDC